ncbi:hypothetical protein OPIT5_06305 [Opitutaceae bacterium TAV5]|nr:hypothetical protein OPIT5_06305 [Opitutaceae bacterium TAV5]
MNIVPFKPVTVRTALLFTATLALLAPGLSAQDATAVDPSEKFAVNLVRLLVEQKVFTPDQGEALIRQAAAETAAAQAAAAPAPDEMRVAYVPEIVKEQIRDDIKQEVMKQAREENWASPRALPEWVSRYRFAGDFRFRYEGIGFPGDNAVSPTANPFINFNAINTGSPFDISDLNTTTSPPFYNADQDRSRVRIRARLGAEIDLGENFATGIRLATGDSNSPISANQTLGSGPGFSKYAAWIDRAYLRYDMPSDYGDRELTLTVGRFNNPFFATNLLWANDLGFDGALLQARYGIGEAVSPFFTAGIFPVWNTDLNFATTNPTKFESDDKWLYAAQLGFDWKVSKDFDLKVAAAYYAFEKVDGRLSSPYIPLNANDPGDTDGTRPAFAQKGNTYMALRNIPEYYPDGTTLTNQYQYFGLASPFREVALTARASWKGFDPIHLWLDAEVVKNLAYDEAHVASEAVNNFGPGGVYDGGSLGWLVQFNAGHPALTKRWDWQVSLGYRHVETDAVVDAFTDSDFGLGGTNVKGYTLGASLALSKRVWSRILWMSSDSIGGPKFSVDTLQIDLNAKF